MGNLSVFAVLFHFWRKSARICAAGQYTALGGMKKSAWAPALNLQVSVIKRNEADWNISVDGRDHLDFQSRHAKSGSILKVSHAALFRQPQREHEITLVFSGCLFTDWR
jgi:hypothetical protein